jgi:hypothetical protein
MRANRLTPWVLVALVALVAVLVSASETGAQRAAAIAARPLALGFLDLTAFSQGAASDVWFQRAVASSSTVIHFRASWSTIAPSKPADPTNPADPAYDWSSLDEQIRQAASYGLTPIVTLTGAPSWAVGTGAPASATPGTWRPNASAYGQFAEAVGRRYSGSYPDPLHPGQTLPLVRYWEPWNEPNLAIYLAPQWIKTSDGYTPASPALYRRLLNAFYAGIKSTLPEAQVIAGGTAPFGDPPGGQRMPPVVFDRSLFCLSGNALTPEPCPNPAHFNILDHHPYAVGSPYTPALDPNDVAIPDIGKLQRILTKAERTGRALPGGPKPLWVLEVSYNSDPPNPGGVPQPEDALWTEETLYELWSEGVGTITWFLIEDDPLAPNDPNSYQSGMYLLDGEPKLSEQAFRFPLVVDTRRAHHAILWTRVPAAGTLVVQRLDGTNWRQLFSVPVNADEVVERTISDGQAAFRASVAGQSSLDWPP